MEKSPYIQSQNTIRRFFSHIQTSGKPSKVTYKYLESVGFKSKNDRPIIGILKFIGFLDSSGVPTELWQKYRTKQRGGIVLAKAIKSAYSSLFLLYPDAHRKDTEALRDFFSTHTTVGAASLQMMINTFKALCELANFEADASEYLLETSSPPVSSAITSQKTTQSGLVININIELGLPSDADPKTFENLFSAMKKYLIDAQ
ncbi:MAG: DUF5343 domain-containing protein [candidate division Zixibacteria bacterium]